MLAVLRVIQRIGAVLRPDCADSVCISFRTFPEHLPEHFEKLSFFHPPFRRNHFRWFRLGAEAHYDHFFRQVQKEVRKSAGIFVFVERRRFPVV